MDCAKVRIGSTTAVRMAAVIDRSQPDADLRHAVTSDRSWPKLAAPMSTNWPWQSPCGYVTDAPTPRDLPARLNPVLHFMRGHTHEFRGIVGDQHQAFAARVTGNVQVIHTDGRAEAFQGGTNGAIVLRSLGAAQEEAVLRRAEGCDDALLASDAYFYLLDALGQAHV